MGEISATYDRKKNLTYVTATGTMTAQDFHQWMVSYYEGDITLLTLWDLTQADIMVGSIVPRIKLFPSDHCRVITQVYVSPPVDLPLPP